MIRGAIFDVDGTLLNSMPIWDHAGELYLRSQGREAEAGLAELLFPMSLEEGAAYLKEHYLMKQSPEEIIKGIDTVISEFYRNEVLLKSGADTFLKELKEKNIPLVAATSGSGELVEAAFERLGIRSFFKQIITCTEIGKGKSEPDIFLAAAAVIEADPKDIWVFEDTPHAVLTAAKAGFHTAGIFDEASSAHTGQIQAVSDLYLDHFKSFALFWDRACAE